MTQSSRARALFAALVLASGCPGCAHEPEAAAQNTPAGSPRTAAPRYPLVRIVLDDNFADERSSSIYDVGPDGSVEIEHIMSNGGGDSTVKACTGQTTQAEAQDWFARVRGAATLVTPPPGPSRQEAFERNIPSRYTIGYALDPQSMAYADPERWLAELEPWLARLSKSARCHTFTRSG